MLAEQPATEAELRALASEAGGWLRVLEGRLAAREERLGELTAAPESSIADMAEELRHVASMRRQLADTRSLLERLDERSRELRGRWVRR